MTHEQIINAWVWFNAVILVLVILGWPLSAFWFAKDEPQTVLGLSWGAMQIGAMGNLIAVLILRQVDPKVDTEPGTVGNSQREHEEGASGH